MPFRFACQLVEVRGLAGRVQLLKNTAVIAVHARHTDTLLLCNETHYEGEDIMIITTNKSIRDWTELLAGEPHLVSRRLRRQWRMGNGADAQSLSVRLTL